ncbi:MAG TPA: diacylglycerol kinase family lipid kinase [Thermoflexia bacterium]|nr:diacylglycerol kinase family lipid kinase [Thermoflexia bacterium]
MKPIKIILNPIAGRGYGARSEPALRRFLNAEDVNFDLAITEWPGHAIELAQQAASDGFEIIVAAGGDGTTHEVVNGLMAVAGDGVAGTLGVIPVGSGSDFANTVGIPPDLKGACRRLAHGQTRIVDVCRVAVDDQSPRYFDNTVNVGFGGRVTYEALKVKWVRGMALYLPVVLKTIFLSQSPQMTIEYGNQKLEFPAMMVCVANGAREGGGFFTAPNALPDDGLLDLCIVQEIGKMAMLALVPRFMDGSHVNHEAVTMTRTKRVIISSPDDLIAHADGEMLCTDAHRLEFEILPQRLQVRC